MVAMYTTLIGIPQLADAATIDNENGAIPSDESPPKLTIEIKNEITYIIIFLTENNFNNKSLTSI